MASYNRVVLMGNVTRDIELRYLPSGTAVCEIGLAVNERRKNQQTGEWGEETIFVDVTLWNRTAEVAGEYLTKGSSVLIEGRLRMDTWEQDGQKRSKIKVVADQMVLLGSRGQGGASGVGGSQAGYGGAAGGYNSAPRQGGFSNQGGYGGNQGGYNAQAGYQNQGGYAPQGGYGGNSGGYGGNQGYQAPAQPANPPAQNAPAPNYADDFPAPENAPKGPDAGFEPPMGGSGSGDLPF